MKNQWQDDEEEETTRGMTLVAYVLSLAFVMLIVITMMAGAGLLAQGGF